MKKRGQKPKNQAKIITTVASEQHINLHEMQETIIPTPEHELLMELPRRRRRKRVKPTTVKTTRSPGTVEELQEERSNNTTQVNLLTRSPNRRGRKPKNRTVQNNIWPIEKAPKQGNKRGRPKQGNKRGRKPGKLTTKKNLILNKSLDTDIACRKALHIHIDKITTRNGDLNTEETLAQQSEKTNLLSKNGTGNRNTVAVLPIQSVETDLLKNRTVESLEISIKKEITETERFRRLPTNTIQVKQEPNKEHRKRKSIIPRYKTKADVFQCYHCSKNFHYKPALTAHMVTHTTFVPINCPQCPAVFKRKETLKFHLKTIHVKSEKIDRPEERSFICPECGKGFTTKHALCLHQKCHSDERPFICELCSESFKRKQSLQKHRTYKHGNGKRLAFACATCHKILSSKPSYVKHLQRHAKLYTVFCEHCGKGFYGSSALRLHVNNKHSETRSYVCDICTRPCSSQRALRNHKESHDIGFKAKNMTNCNVCGKLVKQKYLKWHIKKMHSEQSEKRMCEVCGKHVFGKLGLSYHMNTHTGNKPYKCQYCPNSFANPMTLRDHTRRHTGDKPYKCDFCDKAFTHSHSRKVHEKLHTGEKPFSCDYCDKKFPSKSTLTAHIKSSHGTPLH